MSPVIAKVEVPVDRPKRITSQTKKWANFVAY